MGSRSAATNPVTRHYYANGLQVATTMSSSLYYLHQDALGSNRLVSTSGAANYFSTNYEPFGPLYGSSGTWSFMYTGQLQDSVTGLYYLGARFYDINIGRFISEDSSQGNNEDPQSHDRYSYVENNPLRARDTTGHAGGVMPTFAMKNTSPDPISTWWNSLSPNEKQAIVVSVTVVAAAAVTIATAGAGSPVAAVLISAAISSTGYTVAAGKNANPQGALITAVVGGATAGFSGAAVWAISAEPIESVAVQGALKVGIYGTTNFFGDTLKAAGTGQPVFVSPTSIIADLLSATPLGRVPGYLPSASELGSLFGQVQLTTSPTKSQSTLENCGTNSCFTNPGGEA